MYKCTYCFKEWPKSKLKPDPLRPQTLICPKCEWPCAPEDSRIFVPEGKKVVVPEDGLSISIEPKVDLSEGMKKALIALSQGEKAHGASVKALERRGLVAEGELTEEGFNQLKGELQC